MQLSDLLDNDNREIDLPGTRKNVINFFNNQYEKLKYLANITPLSSVSYDNIRVKTSQSNSIEDKTIRQLQAKEYLRIIDDCINSLDDIKKTIFKGKLIDYLTSYQLEELTGYSERQILRISNNACCEFAQKLSLVTDIDLIVYK